MEPPQTTVEPPPKAVAKFNRAIQMFKDSPIVSPLFAAHQEKASKAKNNTNLLSKTVTGFIDKMDFFKDENEKKEFGKQLDELTNEPSFISTLNNPFVSTLMNLLTPLALKFLNAKLNGDAPPTEGTENANTEKI